MLRSMPPLMKEQETSDLDLAKYQLGPRVIADIRYRRGRALSWHLSFLTKPTDEPRRRTVRQLQRLCR